MRPLQYTSVSVALLSCGLPSLKLAGVVIFAAAASHGVTEHMVHSKGEVEWRREIMVVPRKRLSFFKFFNFDFLSLLISVVSCIVSKPPLNLKQKSSGDCS